MVLIDGKKFACETCIKGHRSSACKHIDRPLSEIHKKGRPVTQCTHCRELRKTKQMHVKCNCGGSKEVSPGSSGEIPKPTQKTPEVVRGSAVPSTSGSSAALHSDHSSDSEPGYPKTQGCNCDTTGECHCCAPRKAKARRRKTAKISEITSNSHLRELRPVLPKPPSSHHEHKGPIHLPSPPHPPSRHHSHSDVLYSPYERAYEASHTYEPSAEFNPMEYPDLDNEISMSNVIVTSPDGQSVPWDAFNTEPATSQALCGCGPTCACPGCFEHRGSVEAIQALLAMPDSGCTDPVTCTSCVQCSIILPTSQPMQTEMQDVEEWLRQLTAPSPIPPDGSSQPLLYAAQDQVQPIASASSYNDPSMTVGDWMYNEYNAPNSTDQCNCPLQMCTCGSESCGCDRCERDGHHFGNKNPPNLALSAERTSYTDVLAPQFVDSQKPYLVPHAPLTPPSSERSHSSRPSRASSLSASDGERWEGLRVDTALRTRSRANSATESLYEESDVI